MKSISAQISLLIKVIRFIYAVNSKAALLRSVAQVVITVLNIVNITLLGKFIDQTARVLSDFDKLDFERYFYTDSFRSLALILAIWIVSKLLSNLQFYYGDILSSEISTLASKTQMLEKIASENQQEVEQKRFQELLVFVPYYSIDEIYNSYVLISDVLTRLVQVLSSTAILVGSMGPSALIILLISFPEPLVQYLHERGFKKYKMGEIEGIKFVDYLFELARNVRNFAELKVNGIFKYIRRSFGGGNRAYLDSMFEKYKHYYIDNAFFAMLARIGLKVYIVYILFYSVANGLSIGDFKALYDYSENSATGSYFLGRSVLRLVDSLSYVGEFFKFLEYEGFGDVSYGDVKLGKGTPELQLMMLDFQYPDRKSKNLENLTMSIKPGEKVAIVGGDGSGKSSLVKLLAGLYEIKAGDYLIDGYSIRELAKGELKNKLSVIFQDFVRYNLSTKESITIGSGRERLNSELYKKVKKIALVDQFMKQEGINDNQRLGKQFAGGHEISPGFWQRLAIARMLYRNREIMILDEPFMHVDGKAAKLIIEGILDFAGKERTVIFITQNTDHVDLFDKIYLLENGKISESGTYRELVKKRGRFYKFEKTNQ